MQMLYDTHTASIQWDNKKKKTHKKEKKKSFALCLATLAQTRIVGKEMKNIIFTFTQIRMYNTQGCWACNGPLART